MSEEFEIVHAVPGRIRFRLAALRRDPTLIDTLATLRPTTEGGALHAIKVNPSTGTILIVYDETEPEALAPVLELLQIAGFVGGEVTAAEFERSILADRNRGLRTERLPRGLNELAYEAQNAANALNERIKRGVGEIGDLRELIPLTFVALGIKNLFFRGKKETVPPWLNYFYFALSSFLMLHRTDRGQQQSSIRPESIH